jgi:hypothetical protein
MLKLREIGGNRLALQSVTGPWLEASGRNRRRQGCEHVLAPLDVDASSDAHHMRW